MICEAYSGVRHAASRHGTGTYDTASFFLYEGGMAMPAERHDYDMNGIGSLEIGTSRTALYWVRVGT